MRRLMLTAALLTTACASTGSTPLQAPPATRAEVITTERDGGVRIITNAAGQPIGRSFAVPPARMWPVAVDAYARVGLRIDGSDPAQHMVQTRSLQVRRKLNGVPLSTYFDCGSEMTGPRADSWRLTIDGRMAVSPTSPDSSAVTTILTVVARPFEGNSATPTACSSTGRLESKLTDAVAEALTMQRP